MKHVTCHTLNECCSAIFWPIPGEAPAWVLVANRRCTFSADPFGKFVYKLLDNECFLIGENQIRQFTTFGQAKQLFSSLEYIFCGVSSCTFWNFNGFTPSSVLLIFAEWNIAICSAHEPFFVHCDAVSIKSLLCFSNHFCWCCSFLPSTSLDGRYSDTLPVSR